VPLPACGASLVLFFVVFTQSGWVDPPWGVSSPPHPTHPQLFPTFLSPLQFVPSSLLSFIIGHFLLQVPAEDHDCGVRCTWIMLNPPALWMPKHLILFFYPFLSFLSFFRLLGNSSHLIYYGGILCSAWRKIRMLSHVVLLGAVLRLR